MSLYLRIVMVLCVSILIFGFINPYLLSSTSNVYVVLAFVLGLLYPVIVYYIITFGRKNVYDSTGSESKE